jgi:hypothetical protein
MSTSLLYHAFGIRGYQYTRTDSQDGQVIFTIRQEPKTCRCSACGAREVQSRGHVARRFRSLPIGGRATAVSCPSRVSNVAPVAWCVRSRSRSPTRGGATPTPSSATRWSCRGA